MLQRFDAYLKAINTRASITSSWPDLPASARRISRPPSPRANTSSPKNPSCVDGPGARIMYAAGEEAKKKGLKVAAGTQRRHHAGYIETIKRIQDGAIGDVTALRAYWVNGNPDLASRRQGRHRFGRSRSTTGITTSGCAPITSPSSTSTTLTCATGS
jgi:myo-inositol 2-dehydrogenase/D-chiro-inositol 1-dehydrogenase